MIDEMNDPRNLISEKLASKEKLNGPSWRKTIMMMIWAISGVYVNAFVEIYLHETVFGPNQLEYEPLWDIYGIFSIQVFC